MQKDGGDKYRESMFLFYNWFKNNNNDMVEFMNDENMEDVNEDESEENTERDETADGLDNNGLRTYWSIGNSEGEATQPSSSLHSGCSSDSVEESEL